MPVQRKGKKGKEKKKKNIPLLFIICVLFVSSVRQLHREFLRAGADVMQAFTFYASDDKLENRGNEAQSKYTVRSLQITQNIYYCATSDKIA